MSQILFMQSCHFFRQRLLPVKSNISLINIIKTKQSKALQRYICDKSPKSYKFIYSPWKVCTGLSLGVATRWLLGNGPVFCKANPSNRVIQRRPNLHEDSEKFDWDRFFQYLVPHKYLIAAAIVATLAVAFLNVYIPAILGEVVNVLASLRKESGLNFFDAIKMPAVKLFILYIAQAGFTFLYIHMLAQVGEKVASQMKQDLFISILKQDMTFFDRERTGELVNRVTVDVQDFKSSFKQTISAGMRAMAQVFGSALSLLVISSKLTGLTLICIPSVVFGGAYIGSLLRQLSREAQAQEEKATLIAEEAISNIRTVRAFSGEANEAATFADECDKMAELNMDLGWGIGLFQAGTNLFLNGMVLATMFMGGALMSAGQLSAGDVMAFLVSAQTIQRSVAQLSLLFGAVMKGTAAGGRVFEYINKEPTMDTSGTRRINMEEFRGDIVFKNVTFSYPTRPESIILKDFNLSIPAGSIVAIVGASGSGKSTIAALLERFYDVEDGKVTVDSVDLRDLDAVWLRACALGFISQEPVLFATTVRENIKYSKPEATDEEVYDAARIANAHDFVSKFPEGYETMVGERGMALSGGEKQRIAIARAILKNPPILILDEATSALDSASEKVVQQALETACQKRTVLVIAHRLSTIRNADLIVVLDKGKIVEMGTHSELTKRKGYYYNLIRQQEKSADSSND